MPKKINLTDKDRKILDFLKEQIQAKGPTDIGLYYNQSYNNASSWCSNSLKKLVKAGLVNRFAGKYLFNETK